MAAQWRPKTWKHYTPCSVCGANAGMTCTAVHGGSGLKRGMPLTKPHPGRYQVSTDHRGRRVDREVADKRLTVWKRRALLGDLVADIAAELGMKRSALDQYVIRARRRGHPKAVYHASIRRT